jgi:predicted Zn-ribbon and HTH transcriptional regulator
MNIQAEKQQLAKLILETDNPNIIESIKEIFKTNKAKDFWDELSDAQKSEIENATLEIEHGETTDYDVFMKKYR